MGTKKSTLYTISDLVKAVMPDRKTVVYNVASYNNMEEDEEEYETDSYLKQWEDCNDGTFRGIGSTKKDLPPEYVHGPIRNINIIITFIVILLIWISSSFSLCR